MVHGVILMLMKLWCPVRAVQSHSFCVLPVIMIAVSLLLLILLLQPNEAHEISNQTRELK